MNFRSKNVIRKYITQSDLFLNSLQPHIFQIYVNTTDLNLNLKFFNANEDVNIFHRSARIFWGTHGLRRHLTLPIWTSVVINLLWVARNEVTCDICILLVNSQHKIYMQWNWSACVYTHAYGLNDDMNITNKCVGSLFCGFMTWISSMQLLKPFWCFQSLLTFSFCSRNVIKQQNCTIWKLFRIIYSRKLFYWQKLVR